MANVKIHVKLILQLRDAGRQRPEFFAHFFGGSPGQVLLCLKFGHHGRLSRTHGPDVYPGFW